MQKQYTIAGKKVEQYHGSDFKKDWTDKEFQRVHGQIYNFFRATFINSKYIASKSRLDDIFGLPYTSSSAYAGLWNTNSAVYIDGENITIEGFLLTENNQVVCYCQDGDENEFNFIIGIF